MKKIYSLLIVLLFVGSAFAQKTATIGYTETAPVIDGFIEETWDAAATNAIDVPFQTEVATIGSSTWQALYDDTYFYVVVYVDDDDFYPAWAVPSDATWTYDKPEIYWDVNELLKDGAGVNAAGSAGGTALGHWQLAQGFVDGSEEMEITVTAASTINPGGSVGYSVSGETYVYEHKTPWANLIDGTNTPYDITSGRKIGFDVTVIDQDQDITTARQRMNWANAGAIDEAWVNMDDCGVLTLGAKTSKTTLKNLTMSVRSNAGTLTINADFNKIVISNILGQQVKSANASSKSINISDLSKGVYVVKAYKNNNYVGTAKFTNN